MSVEIERIKGICFDVDGTLSDTDDLWVSKLGAILQSVSILFPERQTAPIARRIIMASESPANLAYHLLDRFDLDDDMLHFYQWATRFRLERKPGFFWIIPGVKEMLQQLNERYPLAVVSARGGSTFQFLEQYELLPFFRVVVTAETCRFTKPYPDPVLWAAEKMGLGAADCLMVGDTAVDIRAGKAAGAQTAGVLCGFGEEKELRRAGAGLILSSTADLLNVVIGPSSVGNQ